MKAWMCDMLGSFDTRGKLSSIWGQGVAVLSFIQILWKVYWDGGVEGTWKMWPT